MEPQTFFYLNFDRTGDVTVENLPLGLFAAFHPIHFPTLSAYHSFPHWLPRNWSSFDNEGSTSDHSTNNCCRRFVRETSGLKNYCCHSDSSQLFLLAIMWNTEWVLCQELSVGPKILHFADDWATLWTSTFFKKMTKFCPPTVNFAQN